MRVLARTEKVPPGPWVGTGRGDVSDVDRDGSLVEEVEVLDLEWEDEDVCGVGASGDMFGMFCTMRSGTICLIDERENGELTIEARGSDKSKVVTVFCYTYCHA